jgi:hypothetical protein
MTATRKLTTRELVQAINDDVGVPMTPGTFNKLSSQGRGPVVAGRYGKHNLYDREPGLEWARALIRPVGADSRAGG